MNIRKRMVEKKEKYDGTEEFDGEKHIASHPGFEDKDAEMGVTHNKDHAYKRKSK